MALDILLVGLESDAQLSTEPSIKVVILSSLCFLFSDTKLLIPCHLLWYNEYNYIDKIRQEVKIYGKSSPF